MHAVSLQFLNLSDVQRNIIYFPPFLQVHCMLELIDLIVIDSEGHMNIGTVIEIERILNQYRDDQLLLLRQMEFGFKVRKEGVVKMILMCGSNC
mgnify:CR=1 FL=1